MTQEQFNEFHEEAKNKSEIITKDTQPNLFKGWLSRLDLLQDSQADDILKILTKDLETHIDKYIKILYKFPSKLSKARFDKALPTVIAKKNLNQSNYSWIVLKIKQWISQSSNF